MVSKVDWELCASQGCIARPMAGSAYCRPCARKASLEEYRKISAGHAAIVDSRLTGAEAVFAGVEPWEILFCLSEIEESRSAYTYVIGFHKTVKIGYGSPLSRLCTLQIGNPRKLRVLASIESSPRLERFLHRAFKGVRIRGEWFRMTDQMRELIKNIRANNLEAVCKTMAEMISSSDKKFFPRLKRQEWMAQGIIDELV